MWHSPFYNEPIKVDTDELKSPNGKKRAFKVGQKFAHPLYTYRIEIVNIKAYRTEQISKSDYNNADLIVQPYFQKDKDRTIKMEEYEVQVKDINSDKWFLIEEKEGE